MAQPSPVPPSPAELSLTDVRTRLPMLARMTQLTGGVTLITDAGRPIAALVPVEAARSRADADAAAARRQAAAHGWQRRLEVTRDDLQRQHTRRLDELRQALEQTWQLIDAHSPPGTDRHVDELRLSHRGLATG